MTRPLLALAALFFALNGCARKIDEIPDPNEVQVQVTAEMQSLFAEGREARAWLSNSGNVLFEMGNQAGREWTEKLYAAGASVVKVCDANAIEEGKTGEISAMLGVGYPDDPARRAALLKVVNELAAVTDNDEYRDIGQKFDILTVD